LLERSLLLAGGGQAALMRTILHQAAPIPACRRSAGAADDGMAEELLG
jgi:hypothetical protein